MEIHIREDLNDRVLAPIEMLSNEVLLDKSVIRTNTIGL